MRKKMEWNWEVLDEFTKRAKVMGGWTLLYGSHTNKGSISNSMVFIPDRDHEWYITKPKEELEAAKPTVKAADFEPK